VSQCGIGERCPKWQVDASRNDTPGRTDVRAPPSGVAEPGWHVEGRPRGSPDAKKSSY
jgi:hypothetical protein